MAKELARGDDASMQLIDMLIDQNDGEIDDRTIYLANKIFQKRAAGARAPATNAAPAAAAPAAAAPSAAPSAPTTGGTATSQPAPGATITRLLLSTVKPGDLITAGFMNDIIAALLALDNRLALLEKTATTVPATTPGTGTGTTTTPSEPRTPRPVIKTAEAVTLAGRGVIVTVTGKGLSEGLLETVMLGKTPIEIEDAKKFQFSDGGFTFKTTQPIFTESRGELTVVTTGGRDTAEIGKAKKPIA